MHPGGEDFCVWDVSCPGNKSSMTRKEQYKCILFIDLREMKRIRHASYTDAVATVCTCDFESQYRSSVFFFMMKQFLLGILISVIDDHYESGTRRCAEKMTKPNPASVNEKTDQNV